MAQIQDPVLKRALKTISDNVDQKVKHDSEINLIQRLFKEGFEVKDPTGTKKIGSKTLQQALWRVVNKMKFLDFQIQGTGKDEIIEKVVTDGVWTVAEEGGLTRALRDKGGSFWDLALYGDGFIYVGTDPDDKYPIRFSPISPSNLYVDAYATGFRSGGIGKDVTQCVVVYTMSPDEALRRYGDRFPKIKKAKGKIKRYLTLDKDQERTFQQESKIKSDIVEVAFYYDINKEEYLMFAGSDNVILEKKVGDKYPFVKDKVSYIPILHFICQPSSDGFWNYGIGQILYDLAVVTRRLINMGVGHVDENVYPITLVNVPNGEAAEFFNKLQLAHEMRAAGKKGVVAVEYDPSNPGAGRVDASALITQSTLMTEWQVLLNRLDNEIKRIGINLDDISRGSNPTASQIISEEENADSFVRQVMEYNASESQFTIELVLDFMAKFIKPSDDTPLNLTTSIGLTSEGEINVKDITMGAIAEEIKDYHYFVKVNSRTGALPSNIMRIAQLNRQMSITPPNSPAFVKLWQKYAKLNDVELSAEDYVGQQPEGQEEPANTEPGEALPTPTDKREINPYDANPRASF